MIYARAQISRVSEVERLVRVPQHRSPSRSEVRRPRNPPWPCRPQSNCRSNPHTKPESNSHATIESHKLKLTEQHAAPSPTNPTSPSQRSPTPAAPEPNLRSRWR